MHHSHPIDEVIVDGIPVSEDQSGTQMFMAACPKAELQALAGALSGAGVETEVFDLDATLLVEAARTLGRLAPPPPPEGEGEAPAAEPAGDTVVLLGLGQSSAILAVVVDGRLHTARSLRWGLDHLERGLAADLGVSELEARLSLRHHLGLPLPELLPGAVDEVPLEEALGEVEGHEGPAPAGGDEAEAPSWVLHEVPDELLARANARLATALQRELVRFLAGVSLPQDPSRILATGGGIAIPGLTTSMESTIGLPVEPLDLVGSCESQVELDELEPELDLALAAAMACLGSFQPLVDFRQEELEYKRRFDRLKFPLATLVLTGAVVLFFLDILYVKAVTEVGYQIARYHEEPKTQDGTKLKPGFGTGAIHRYVFSGRSRTFNHELSQVGVALGKRANDKLQQELREADPFDRAAILVRTLRNHEHDLQKRTGYNPELKLEPGMAVWQAFATVIAAADADAEIKRFIVPEFQLQVGYNDNSRKLTFTIAFEGSTFRNQNGRFRQILEAATGPDSPFEAPIEEPKERLLDEGIYKGQYDYFVRLKSNYGVFQPL
ncbi:MAG: hypothetical protein R3F30_00840 [Planctomycetota bacterium]